MDILVINCGSSSLKYQLIDMEGEKVLAKGLVERIGIEGSRIKHEPINAEKVVIEEPIQDHKKALKMVVEAIVSKEHGVIESMNQITAVGHRVVHGGEDFSKSVIITDKVMEALEKNIELAPLHNPPNITGIEACKAIMPDVPMVAVFDTAFHQTIPEENYIYAIPYEYYEKYKIRRYGFHGTSHKYVAFRTAEILGRDLKDLNIVTCHLGNGASITAIKSGVSIDTSMGFTPLEGLAMGTRSGNIDPAIIPFLMKKENMSCDEVNDVLNKESGVLGVSGISSDFRDLEDEAAKGNKRAQLALNLFANRVKKYIAAYIAELGRVDAIVFTAGVGENSPLIRKMVCDGLNFIGVSIDNELNDVKGKERIISSEDSKVKVLIVPTNEELMIARETMELVK
ncbi:acetate kinase [Soehngenia longivitae]|uniref:Acetate kinase n=1 Tax=Soehngenia longivitae TaxID=2562294 RepID=A0A4Z0D231_9FIRM|nr:acetate kinase [Soehngenia longivitae]TFZ39587.1 acetate kinase [Soehngenia longivitae]